MSQSRGCREIHTEVQRIKRVNREHAKDPQVPGTDGTQSVAFMVGGQTGRTLNSIRLNNGKASLQ